MGPLRAEDELRVPTDMPSPSVPFEGLPVARKLSGKEEEGKTPLPCVDVHSSFKLR